MRGSAHTKFSSRDNIKIIVFDYLSNSDRLFDHILLRIPGRNMKKLLILAIILASTGITSLTTEAKTIDLSGSTKTIAANVVSPQRNIQFENRRQNNRRRRVITRSRIIRVGNHYYREIYQIRYSRNGRTQIRIISRTRIR